MEREPHRRGPRDARSTPRFSASGADRAAAGAALGAAALVVVAQLLDFEAWGLRVHALDASREWSWSHVVSSAAIAVAATLCALGASRAGERGRRRAWRAAAILLAVLFADNVTRLHEHVAHWPLLYAPVVAALGVIVVVLAGDRPGARLARAAVALLCASFAIHVGGPTVVRALGWSPASLAYQVKVALKEGGELAGWVLLLAGLARLVEPRGAAHRRPAPGPGYAA